jgi:hypothetical protein
MKTIKILAALTIMLGITMSAMAQSDNDNCLEKQLVLQAMNVDRITDLDFGWVSPGLAKTIDLENGVTGGQVGEGTETTGVFSVSAAAGSRCSDSVHYLARKSGIKKVRIIYQLEHILLVTTQQIAFTGVATFAPGTATQVSSGNFPDQ